ncbi:MAG: hypothetical protein OMM_12245 [Candidatus Magnetoglobus multicellularis str. Araruama]|uniref:DUF3592 domain-containing protein n=1 Tax=Candidatus Magnetoglobus multicellularis str. Araruama TaxID=890399 RepID=A0A1V1NWD1_9BACT|nr:MAG: hypothetical protein OMM_12245 [Candidatus Magnetoglobus multicellularis str. Araruama]
MLTYLFYTILISLYIGTGIYIEKAFSELIGLSIFFAINIYCSMVLIRFIKGVTVDATIVDSNYGYTNMRMGKSNRYYVKYIYISKEYTKRVPYSTSSNYNNGDQVKILINKSNQIIIRNHLIYFILLNIFFIILTIFLLIA